jgi:hypothetical protein
MPLKSRLFLLILLAVLGSACSGSNRVAATLRSAASPSPSPIPSPSHAPSPSPTDWATPQPTPQSRTWSGQFGDAHLDLTVSPTNASSTSEVTFSYHVKIGGGHELNTWSLEAGDGEHVWTTSIDETACPRPPSTPTPPFEASYTDHMQYKAGHYKPRLNYSFVTCNPDGSTTPGPDGSVEGDLDVQ